MASAEAMYFKASADGFGSQHSNRSRVLKMGAAFIGGSCLAFLFVMAISISGPEPQTAYGVESTSLFGLPASSRSATPGAMMPKPMAAGWRTEVVRPGAPLSRQADGRRSVTASGFQNAVVAEKYATALMEVAKGGKKLEQIRDAVETMRLAMADVPDLQKTLESRVVSPEKRGKIVDGIIKQKNAQLFFKTLINAGRANCLTDAIEAFDKLYCEQAGIVTAKVISAKELDENEQFKVAKKIQELSKCKSVKIKPVVDKNLIGGVVLEWGSERLDLSIRGKLDRIKKGLMASQYDALVK
jgi:F-type H+-transporting ATPase subunit delta